VKRLARGKLHVVGDEHSILMTTILNRTQQATDLVSQLKQARPATMEFVCR
tara:strand:- start:12711 stop:12863 length:153 start_codon:yes stop_codon:yes gene_type:complete